MQADIDHVVLWVEDPLTALAFYRDVVGLEGLRAEAFEASQAPFPSVRLSARSILDLMPKTMAPLVSGFGRQAGLSVDTAGFTVNHLCLSMSRDDYQALRERLEAAGHSTGFGLKSSFGARGTAPETFYFHDLDGNVIEARWYDED